MNYEEWAGLIEENVKLHERVARIEEQWEDLEDNIERTYDRFSKDVRAPINYHDVPHHTDRKIDRVVKVLKDVEYRAAGCLGVEDYSDLLKTLQDIESIVNDLQSDVESVRDDTQALQEGHKQWHNLAVEAMDVLHDAREIVRRPNGASA